MAARRQVIVVCGESGPQATLGDARNGRPTVGNRTWRFDRDNMVELELATADTAQACRDRLFSHLA